MLFCGTHCLGGRQIVGGGADIEEAFRYMVYSYLFSVGQQPVVESTDRCSWVPIGQGLEDRGVSYLDAHEVPRLPSVSSRGELPDPTVRIYEHSTVSVRCRILGNREGYTGACCEMGVE